MFTIVLFSAKCLTCQNFLLGHLNNKHRQKDSFQHTIPRARIQKHSECTIFMSYRPKLKLLYLGKTLFAKPLFPSLWQRRSVDCGKPLWSLSSLFNYSSIVCGQISFSWQDVGANNEQHAWWASIQKIVAFTLNLGSFIPFVILQKKSTNYILF